MATSIKMWQVNDWKKVLGDHCADALNMSVQVVGRTGVEACKHMIILMAQSARAMAFKSKKLRPIERDAMNGPYVRTWNQRDSNPHFVFKWQFDEKTDEKYRLKGTWDKAKRIKNAGLASRSWMWGLKDINAPGAMESGKGIPGVANTRLLLSEKVCGFILTNRLSYIMKAMPAGFQSMVQELAANKIIKQAQMKMQRDFARITKGMEHSDKVTIAKAFMEAA